jgi:hypothetical protein
MDFNILDFGASTDAVDNTEAIQKAIDSCAQVGGRVVVPSGTFVTGTIQLKSNVELHLEEGSKLIATEDREKYNKPDVHRHNWYSKSEGWSWEHLIYCFEGENVSITGKGIIDGKAHAFFGERCIECDSYAWREGVARQKQLDILRPGQLINFAECKNIKICDVTICNSSAWTLYIHGCEFVDIRGIKIYNERYHLNTDGIDIDTSKYVTVEDVDIDTGDDAIAIRCSHFEAMNNKNSCENITVNNCRLASASSVFRIGVGKGSIGNIKVSNIESPYGGSVINFNPEWPGSCTPIDNVEFTDINAKKACIFARIDVSMGTPLSNLSIKRAKANAMVAFSFRNESDVLVKNVLLEDISVRANKDEIMDINQRRPAFAHVKNVDNISCKNICLEIPDALKKDHDRMILLENAIGTNENDFKIV